MKKLSLLLLFVLHVFSAFANNSAPEDNDPPIVDPEDNIPSEVILTVENLPSTIERVRSRDRGLSMIVVPFEMLVLEDLQELFNALAEDGGFSIKSNERARMVAFCRYGLEGAERYLLGVINNIRDNYLCETREREPWWGEWPDARRANFPGVSLVPQRFSTRTVEGVFRMIESHLATTNIPFSREEGVSDLEDCFY